MKYWALPAWKAISTTNVRGLSLLETIIVCALLSFIVVLSIPHISPFFYESQVKAELLTLMNICELQHQRAVLEQCPCTIIFDPKYHSYSYDDSTIHFPPQVRFHLCDGVKGPPASPRNLPSDVVTFDRHTITFYPEGNIQAGSIYCSDHMYRCQYAVTVPVDGPPRFHLYRYSGNWVAMA